MIAEEALDWHNQRRYCGCAHMTAEVYQQQAGSAMDHLTKFMTQNMKWYESLSQALPTPQLVTLQTPKFTVKRGSIMLKPSQLELEMYKEELRLSGGQRKLFPLAFEIYRLQLYTKAVIAINGQQARAIEEMYRMTTGLGIWRIILACEKRFPEPLCTALSQRVRHKVKWLLAEPGRFDDEEPSCVFHDTEASVGNHQQQHPSMKQQLEGPVSRPQQQVPDVHQQQAGDAAEAHTEQQPSAAVKHAPVTEKVGSGIDHQPKAKGKSRLRWACKRLLGVLACGLLAKGAQAAATRLVGSKKPLLIVA